MSACAVGLLRESILIRRRRNSFALLMVVKDGEYANVRVGDYSSSVAAARMYSMTRMAARGLSAAMYSAMTAKSSSARDPSVRPSPQARDNFIDAVLVAGLKAPSPPLPHFGELIRRQ